MSIDSLPNLRPGQLAEMQREAEKRMRADGIIPEQEKVTQPKKDLENVRLAEPLEQLQERPTIFPDIPPAAPEEPESVEDNVSTTEDNVSTVQSEPVKHAPQESFRALREKAERAERERDEALRYVKEIQQRKPEQQYTAPEAEESETNIPDEDLVEGKHLNKMRKELQALRQESRQRLQQSNEYAVEAKLKSQYPDFDKIVSVDNLKDLSFAFPELANSIHSNPDMYSKAVAAYTAIKKLGISQQDSLQADKDRALKNAAKPRPLASVSPQQGESPLTKANAFAQGLTDDLKVQLRREMEAARRNM